MRSVAMGNLLESRSLLPPLLAAAIIVAVPVACLLIAESQRSNLTKC